MSMGFRELVGWLRDAVTASAMVAFVSIGVGAGPAAAGTASSCKSTPPLDTLEMTQPINSVS